MMQEWLGKVVDREDLTRHDKWLCMMTPRLKLLRELLREDGVIFVSIDDNEVHHLRMLMDEVFGEENPWIAYEIGKSAVKTFLSQHDEKTVIGNLAFIIEELRRVIEKERDRLAAGVFRDLIEKKILYFFLIAEKGGYKLPSRMKVKNNATPLAGFLSRSLFDFVPEEGFNGMEKSIALYLDGQEKLLWWYRNISRQDYYVQGWKKHRIYPDFIFTDNDEKKKDYSKVFVVESKGVHLKNEDTDYKKSVFEFCNRLGEQKEWKELNLEFVDRRFEFQVVFGDEWEAKINRFLPVSHERI